MTVAADYLPVSGYSLIGDLHSVALVGTDGTIDWHCSPSFDAPAVFGALLDSDRGGRFELAAAVPAKTRQFDLPDTNVLITRFFAEDGVGEIQVSILRVRAPAAGFHRRGGRLHELHAQARHASQRQCVWPAAGDVRHRRAHRAPRTGTGPPARLPGSAPVRIGNAAATIARRTGYDTVASLPKAFNGPTGALPATMPPFRSAARRHRAGIERLIRGGRAHPAAGKNGCGSPVAT